MNLLTKPLKILLISDGSVMIAAAMLVPFYALFVERIGGDVLDVGIGAALFAIAGGISVLVAGRFADKVRRKERIIAWSYLIMALGFIFYIFVDTIWLLLIAQAIIGLAEASYIPSHDALYGENAHAVEGHAAKRWSFSEASYYFSSAIGAGLGAAIVHYAGFDALFGGMAFLAGAASLYLFLLPEGAFDAATPTVQEG